MGLNLLRDPLCTNSYIGMTHIPNVQCDQLMLFNSIGVEKDGWNECGHLDVIKISIHYISLTHTLWLKIQIKTCNWERERHKQNKKMWLEEEHTYTHSLKARRKCQGWWWRGKNYGSQTDQDDKTALSYIANPTVQRVRLTAESKQIILFQL